MIKIYDDVFGQKYRDYIWGFIKKSFYTLGWEDDEIFEHSGYKCIHSHYNDNDINRIGIESELRKSDVSEQIKNKHIVKMVINLSMPGQTFFDHTHYNDWTNSDKTWHTSSPPLICLYYASLEWRREWGGETMFYSEDCSELERAIEYKPNRVVCFSGEHPHSVRPATLHAPFYRFTASMFFSDEKQNGK